MRSENPYRAGGTCAKASYIEREADTTLQGAIRDNKAYPFFLASRQSGKSSVIQHAQKKCSSDELQFTIIDLSFCTQKNLSAFDIFIAYFMDVVFKKLNLGSSLQQELAKLKNESLFFLEAIKLLLQSRKGRFVICVDEIDVLLRTDFKDDFFSQVRALFNERASDESMRRVQFVLAGATSCNALISDPMRSPFNVGEHILLKDLDLTHLKDLLGIAGELEQKTIDEAASRLLFWTSGSVFLCQYILEKAFHEGFKDDPRLFYSLIDETVDRIVRIAPQEIHFTHIREQIIQDQSLHSSWYFWNNGMPPDNAIIDALYIAGISSRKQPFHNRIYERVFGKNEPLSLEKKHPHSTLDSQPYADDERLANDRTFTGREEPLLHSLRGLWLEPGSKPVVLLTGQRCIGKTSLLNKIKNDKGLKKDAGLLPILVNIQDTDSEYDFLTELAYQIAQGANLLEPVLNSVEPYTGFRKFLRDLPQKTKDRRFLLMLDDADLIPRLGDVLPNFLRSLMQEPQYPILLLFCGSYALRDKAWKYSSILFNSVHAFTLSYMPEAEAAQVLIKSTQGILKFSRHALGKSYLLTHGHPLLLQSLGAIIFNQTILSSRKRSWYVTIEDLQKAAKVLELEGSPAFHDHWKNCGDSSRQVLSLLAWYMDDFNDEGDIPKVSIGMIEESMKEYALSSPDETISDLLKQLVDEEILVSKDDEYRFSVPLYRRWINWRRRSRKM